MKCKFDLTDENIGLLNALAKNGVKESDRVNEAIFESFLPVSLKLSIEARYIFDEHEKGYETDEPSHMIARECISRGIKWLEKHPIQNVIILEMIFGRFPFGRGENGKISTCNRFVKAEMDKIYDLLKERVPGYVKSKGGYDGLVVDMFDNWGQIWQEPVVYDVLSAIVYNSDPKWAFTWVDGLDALYGIDRAAWRQWSDAC